VDCWRPVKVVRTVVAALASGVHLALPATAALVP
jgi:hypothetical protein